MDEKKYDPYTGYEVEGDSVQQDQTEGNVKSDNQVNQDGIVVGDQSYYYDEGAAQQTFNGTPSGSPYMQDAPKPKSGIALASMILGIVSMVLMLSCCCSPIAIITGIAAIVCYAVSPKEAGVREGKATAGLICGIVAIVGTILLIVAFTVNIARSPEFQREFQREFQDAYEESAGEIDDSF